MDDACTLCMINCNIAAMRRCWPAQLPSGVHGWPAWLGGGGLGTEAVGEEGGPVLVSGRMKFGQGPALASI